MRPEARTRGSRLFPAKGFAIKIASGTSAGVTALRIDLRSARFRLNVATLLFYGSSTEARRAARQSAGAQRQNLVIGWTLPPTAKESRIVNGCLRRA
jgi:hypothetical protein